MYAIYFANPKNSPVSWLYNEEIGFVSLFLDSHVLMSAGWFAATVSCLNKNT